MLQPVEPFQYGFFFLILLPDLLVLSLQFFILFDNVQRQFLDLLKQNRLVGAEIDAVLFHVVRRGKVQKLRRIPRAFVERMIADAAKGARVDMGKYAAAWLAEQEQSQASPGAADGAA